MDLESIEQRDEERLRFGSDVIIPLLGAVGTNITFREGDRLTQDTPLANRALRNRHSKDRV